LIGLGTFERSASIAAQLATQIVSQLDGGHMDWNAGWWLVMLIGMLLFWALVVAVVVWLVRTPGLSGRLDRRQPDAIDVLDRRLAEGEIDLDDYEARRKKLLDR
jgi:putative membrane protein